MRTSELNPINCLVWHIVSINVSSIIIFVVVVILKVEVQCRPPSCYVADFFCQVLSWVFYSLGLVSIISFLGVLRQLDMDQGRGSVSLKSMGPASASDSLVGQFCNMLLRLMAEAQPGVLSYSPCSNF